MRAAVVRLAIVLLALGVVVEALDALRAVAPDDGLVSAAVGAGVIGALAAAALVSPAATVLAAAFLLAHWLAFDPYYLPYLRRASDGGLLSAPWVVGLCAVAVGVAALAWRRPELRLVQVPIVLLVAMSALAADAGH